MIKYEEQEEQTETKKDYTKTPVSICELNQHFLQLENQSMQESRQQHNRIDQDFRKYLNLFSVIKKKDDNIRLIQQCFVTQLGDYEQQLKLSNTDDKQFSILLRKLARVQKKAWNLNLDKKEDIKIACRCNGQEFSDGIIDSIAQVIKQFNKE